MSIKTWKFVGTMKNADIFLKYAGIRVGAKAVAENSWQILAKAAQKSTGYETVVKKSSLGLARQKKEYAVCKVFHFNCFIVSLLDCALCFAHSLTTWIHLGKEPHHYHAWFRSMSFGKWKSENFCKMHMVPVQFVGLNFLSKLQSDPKHFFIQDFKNLELKSEC
jgi:hypothetical protein